MIVCKIVMTAGHCYVETHGHAELRHDQDEETNARAVAVCSAVSALMQNLGLGLQAIALKNPDMVQIAVSEWPEGAVQIVPADTTLHRINGKWHTVNRNKRTRAPGKSTKK